LFEKKKQSTDSKNCIVVESYDNYELRQILFTLYLLENIIYYNCSVVVQSD